MKNSPPDCYSKRFNASHSKDVLRQEKIDAVTALQKSKEEEGRVSQTEVK